MWAWVQIYLINRKYWFDIFKIGMYESVVRTKASVLNCQNFMPFYLCFLIFFLFPFSEISPYFIFQNSPLDCEVHSCSCLSKNARGSASAFLTTYWINLSWRENSRSKSPIHDDIKQSTPIMLSNQLCGYGSGPFDAYLPQLYKPALLKWIKC